MAASRRDDDLFRILGGMPRHAAPAVPLEKLLRRLALRRLRIAALCLAGLALPLAAFLLVRGESQPPEHLRLRVVNIGEPIDLPSHDPPELNLP